MICLQPEGFKINGAIVAVDIGTFGQRDRDMRLMCSVGGRNHKRDDGKDCGEREMHLIRAS